MSGPEAEAPATTWVRLSPRMLAVHPIQELMRAIPALVVILVVGSGNDRAALWSAAIAALVMVLGLTRWFTTTYRITPEQVQMRRGLVHRRLISVARDRVRTVDVTANALHRAVGLTRVSVGTGRTERRDDEALTLDGLPGPVAARLREELLHREGAGEATAGPAAERRPESETELARLDPAWIRFGPFTLSGVVAVGVLAGLLARLASEAHVNPERSGALRDVVHHLAVIPVVVAAVEVAVVALLVVALASTLGYVLAFWGFRLSRHSGGTLHVTRGLLTTRATSIEERRLRGAELSEPLLLRAVRGARCLAVATGLRAGRGAERGATLLLPPAPRSEAVRVAGAILGDPAPMTAPLVAHGPRARRRRYTRALSSAVLAVVAVLAVARLADWPSWSWLPALVLLPAAALLAADRYRSLGHAIVTGRLVARSGSVVRRRSALACEGIIGWNVERSFFQRRLGLATLVATTAAGRQGYSVQDVEVDEALRIADAATPGLLSPFLAPAPSPVSGAGGPAPRSA